MSKFVFKLQAVLRQREIIEQQKSREFAIKQQVYTNLEIELKSMQNQVEQTLTDLRTNRLVGKLDLNFLAAHRRFMTAMQKQAVGIAQKMAAAKVQLDAARAALAEAAKQKKIVEKLREQQHERWKTAEAKKETDLLDEVGMQLAYQNLQTEAEPPE